MNPLTQNNVDGVGFRFNQSGILLKNKIGEVQKLEAKLATQVVSQVAPVMPPVAVEVPTTVRGSRRSQQVLR